MDRFPTVHETSARGFLLVVVTSEKLDQSSAYSSGRQVKPIEDELDEQFSRTDQQRPLEEPRCNHHHMRSGTEILSFRRVFRVLLPNRTNHTSSSGDAANRFVVRETLRRY